MAFTPIDNNYVDFGDLMSKELMQLIADNLNYLIDSVPIGTIIPILTGVSGVPTPDSEIWQLCDGSEITNQRSPLRGGNTPNYDTDGVMMKGAAAVGTIGNFGGERFKTLSHNHAGVTGAAIRVVNAQCDDDSDRFTFNTDHTHTMSTDLTSSYNFDPAHIKLYHYMKIN